MLASQVYLVDLILRGRWRTVRRHLAERTAWMTDASPNEFREQLMADLRRLLPPRWLVRRIGNVRQRWKSRAHPGWYTTRFVARTRGRLPWRGQTHPPFPTRHAEQAYRFATSAAYLVQARHRNALASMHGMVMACPFRDRDLVGFLMSIPGDVLNAGGVPKALLRESMRSVLPEAIRLRRWKADFTLLGNQCVINERATIDQLLDGTPLSVSAGLLAGDRLRRDLPALAGSIASDGTVGAAWQVSDIMALESWLRCFCDPTARHSAAGAERIAG